MTLRRVPLFVLSGQSNMEGRAANSELAASRFGPYPGTKIWNVLSLAMQDLEIGVNNKSTNILPTHGPEVTLCPSLRNLLSDEVYFSKLSSDGAPLSPLIGFQDFSEESSQLFDGVTNQLGFVATWMATQGLVPDVRGIFFQQGETDAAFEQFAEEYELRLELLIETWRQVIDSAGWTTWPSGQVPFVMGRIHTAFASPIAKFIASINESKEALAARMVNVFTFETDDLTTNTGGDEIHFDSEAQLELGHRFALTWAANAYAESVAAIEPEFFDIKEIASAETLDDRTERFREAADRLLPQGLAWTRDRESNLRRLVKGLARAWARVDERADKLLLEASPATASELLSDWEEVLGLPGPCPSRAPSDLLRRFAAVARLSFQGGQSSQFFVDFAATLGFEVTVNSLGPATCESNCETPIYDAEWVFAWEVHAPEVTPFFFTAGSSVAGERLVEVYTDSLECEIEKSKPDQTVVHFRYDLDASPPYAPWSELQPSPTVIGFKHPPVLAN